MRRSLLLKPNRRCRDPLSCLSRLFAAQAPQPTPDIHDGVLIPRAGNDRLGETTCLGRQAIVLVWRVVKGLPWRRPGNSQPFLRRMWSDTAGLLAPMRSGRLRGCAGLRSDLIDPTIALHHGRVVKRTGDGVLIEFRSVVDAFLEQSSVAHRLQPSPAHAAWPIAWHNGARHHNRRHSRARVAPRRSGSASVAREQAWPRCRPGVRRVLCPSPELRSWLNVSFVLEGCCTRPQHPTDRVPGHLQVPRNLLDRLALDEVLAPDPADRLHCQHSPTARLESKRAAHQANLKG